MAVITVIINTCVIDVTATGGGGTEESPPPRLLAGEGRGHPWPRSYGPPHTVPPGGCINLITTGTERLRALRVRMQRPPWRGPWTSRRERWAGLIPARVQMGRWLLGLTVSLPAAGTHDGPRSHRAQGPCPSATPRPQGHTPIPEVHRGAGQGCSERLNTHPKQPSGGGAASQGCWEPRD